MTLNNYTQILNQYINLENSVSNNIIDFEDNNLKQQLLLLLKDDNSDLNKKLYLNSTLYKTRVSKRSSSCSTKNGNLGILSIFFKCYHLHLLFLLV